MTQRIKHTCLTTLLSTIMMFSHAALAAGDPVAGSSKAETCYGCHAQASYFNVYPSYKVPKLAGQRPEYIVEALKAYKAGSRSHETMKANAANLSEQDMADIAAFLSTAQ